MGQVKSIQAYSRFPNFVAPLAEEDPAPRKNRPARAAHQNDGIAVPCCIVLRPPAGGPQTSVGTAILTQRVEDVPRRYSFGVLAVELPPPSSFGEYDNYEAVLFEPGLASFVAALTLTPSHAWAGTLSGISLAFTSTMRLIVRPASSETGRSGEPVLVGSVASCSSR